MRVILGKVILTIHYSTSRKYFNIYSSNQEDNQNRSQPLGYPVDHIDNEGFHFFLSTVALFEILTKQLILQKNCV
jgi:hypothetical protein